MANEMKNESKEFDEFMNNPKRNIFKRFIKKTVLREDYILFDYLRDGEYLTRLGYLKEGVMYVNPPYNNQVKRHQTLVDWANLRGIEVVHRERTKYRNE